MACSRPLSPITELVSRAISKLSIQHSPVTEKRRILILFDVNGTVAHRSKHRIKDAKFPPEPLFHINSQHVYERPHTQQLLNRLVRHPACCIGFLTSMMLANAVGISEKVMEQVGKDHIFGVFDRAFHKPDREQGEKSWDTMRDTKKLWASELCQSAGFGPTNTIFIDNEIRKIREHPENAVIVPSFEEPQVASEAPDECLLALTDYLLGLLDTFHRGDCEDVRDHVREAPFLYQPDAEERVVFLPHSESIS